MGGPDGRVVDVVAGPVVVDGPAVVDDDGRVVDVVDGLAVDEVLLVVPACSVPPPRYTSAATTRASATSTAADKMAMLRGSENGLGSGGGPPADGGPGGRTPGRGGWAGSARAAPEPSGGGASGGVSGRWSQPVEAVGPIRPPSRTRSAARRWERSGRPWR